MIRQANVRKMLVRRLQSRPIKGGTVSRIELQSKRADIASNWIVTVRDRSGSESRFRLDEINGGSVLLAELLCSLEEQSNLHLNDGRESELFRVLNQRLYGLAA